MATDLGDDKSRVEQQLIGKVKPLEIEHSKKEELIYRIKKLRNLTIVQQKSLSQKLERYLQEDFGLIFLSKHGFSITMV